MYDYLSHNFKTFEAEIVQACTDAGRLRESVKLITVTKTYPAELLQAVLDTGHLALGENRPQEIIEKVPALKGTPEMHLIGQLQTNKVRKVLPFVQWIHSIDRENLLHKVSTIATELGLTINVLVQVNTSGEESKSGCLPEEAYELCRLAAEAPSLRLRGLMTIGPLEGTEEENRASFGLLRTLGEQVAPLCEGGVCELSMGMSGDFPLAIAEGATMIRVGSRLVGKRH